MLRAMAEKPTIAIAGAGNLATALALSLRNAGYEIEAIIARKQQRSRVRAWQLARKVGARALDGAQGLKSQVLWLCVPDTEIATTSAAFAENFDGIGKIALHSSGALTSDELHALRRAGASVASVHPLMTFVKGSRPSLKNVPFAIEGDAAAVRIARRVVSDLGGKAYAIRKRDKAAYHAWGTFASPMLTALLATTEQMAAAAGVNRKAAQQRMLPILRQTIENYGSKGGARGFSGPIIRGDVETVRRHLDVLRQIPTAQEVYVALARAALAYLPGKNKEALRSLLERQESHGFSWR
ncbi:MAG TPA: DUF2520 domain-containing protein [Candidatus Sulfotelmatobacter sp.]|nr:DUF2520 domain-containing protein [Candidatus Sulfotelmatobacter sp.]